MLDTVLSFLANEVQSYLTRRTASNGGEVGKVAAQRLVNENGTWAVPEGQIGAALVNVDEERTLAGQRPETTYVDGRVVVRQPALRLNLHVVFAVNFQHYPTALKYLSLILTFFQAHTSFTADDFPALDPQIEKLTVELQSLSYEQLNQMWAFVGGKQLPSVVYRVRVVSLQDAEPFAVGPPITTVATEVHGR